LVRALTAQLNFDAAKQPAKQGLTFREWVADYFANKIDLTRKAGGLDRERRSSGDMLLTGIERSVIMRYRKKRLQESILRRGKVVTLNGNPRNATFLTVNREIASLRLLPNVARRTKLVMRSRGLRARTAKNALIKSERDHARKRVCSAGEFRALCESMPHAVVVCSRH
jgi:hypothetical protein